MSRDRGKVSKNQQKRLGGVKYESPKNDCVGGYVGQGKLPGVLQSYVLDCYKNSKKFSVEFFVFFFSINEELRSVVNEHFNGKLFFPNSEYRVCSRKTCLNNVPI